MRGGFFSYYFRTHEVYGLKEEMIQASKRIRSDKSALLSIVLPAVLLIFHDGVQRSSPEDVARDYDKHHGQPEGSGEASGRLDEKGLNLNELLEKDLL